MAGLPKNKKLARRPVTGGKPSKHGPKPHTKVPQAGKGKDKKGGNGPSHFGGLGGYKGVPRKRVKRLVGGVIRDELRDLRKERRSVKRDTRGQVSRIKRDYRRGKQDLRHVFGETGDFLNNLALQDGQVYGMQSEQLANLGTELQSQLQGTYSGAQQQISDEMTRLGLGQGATNLSQLFQDQAFAQSMGAQSSANAQSTANISHGNTQQLHGILQGMNQGSYMSHLGKNLNARNDALFEARQNRADNMQAIREAMRDVRGSRRDLFFQLLNQLQETGWSQWMDLQQLKLARKNSKKK